VDSCSRFNAPALVPGHGSATRRPLPSPGCSRHAFPGCRGTRERSESRPSLPTHVVAFARRLPPRAPVCVAPHQSDAGLGPGVFGSGHPPDLSFSRRRRSGVPRSWGAPLPVGPVQATPAGRRAPDQYGAATWPLVGDQQRLPRKVLRRSLAGRPGSLSTLHCLGCPSQRKTRFQPLVRRFWAGFPPAGLRWKVSECLHLILLLQALLGAIPSTSARKPKCPARGGPTHRLPLLPQALSRPDQVQCSYILLLSERMSPSTRERVLPLISSSGNGRMLPAAYPFTP
jgi:hypothetical protein